MSRRIAAKAFEAIPARHERPSPACGGGWAGGASAAAMLPKQQRRAEPPKAFQPHANVSDPASRVPPYGVFPSNTPDIGSPHVSTPPTTAHLAPPPPLPPHTTSPPP